MSMYSPSGSGNVHVDQVLPGVSVGWPNMPYEIRMSGSKHCVYKKSGGSSLGCHDTHDGATSQLAALYASEGGKMGETYSFLVGIETLQLSESEDTKWVHALPLGEYQHPKYGLIKVDPDRAKRFADNVKTKVRGIEPSLNYNHDNDSSEGATGWVKDAEARSNGLWLFVEFVKDAAQKIREKKFKYFSIEFADEWIDTQGKKFQDVVMGGAITNRPFMKNLVPLNLSESVIDNSFDLVSAITGKPSTDLKGKETHMTEEEMNKIIEGVTKSLAEKLTPQPPKTETTTTLVSKLEEIEELKKLSEENPVVKALFTHFEAQAVALTEGNKKMRETMVDSKLSEFDNSKLSLTPVAKSLAREVVLALGDSDQPKFWALMDAVKTSSTFLVELGQRSGASVRPGYDMSEKTATEIFNDRTNKLMAEQKMSFLEAIEKVASDDPDLYTRYRFGEGAEATK